MDLTLHALYRNIFPQESQHCLLTETFHRSMMPFIDSRTGFFYNERYGQGAIFPFMVSLPLIHFIPGGTLMKKARRVFAIIGIILLVAMYLTTLVFALLDHPMKNSLLLASLYCTVVIPVLIYVFSMAVKWFSKENHGEEKEKP
jgi:amino acid transporter